MFEKAYRLSSPGENEANFYAGKAYLVSSHFVYGFPAIVQWWPVSWWVHFGMRAFHFLLSLFGAVDVPGVCFV